MLASLRCRGLAIALLMAFLMAKGVFWFPLAAQSPSEPKRVCACTGSPVCTCTEGSCCKASLDPIQPETSETGLVPGRRPCGSLSQGGTISGEAPLVVCDPVCLAIPALVSTRCLDPIEPSFLCFSHPPDPPPPRRLETPDSQT
jgi:hypothetical protein